MSDHAFTPRLSPVLAILEWLLPLMISRLMLSLKKASRVGESGWTSNALSRTHTKTITQIAFRTHKTGPEDGGGAVSEEVELSDLSDGQAGGME